MEVSPTIVEIVVNPVETPPKEENMIRANNCRDKTFDDVVTRVSKEEFMICASNCEDSIFHMDVSSFGHDGVMDSKVNDREVSRSGRDGGVLHYGDDILIASKGNDEVDIIDDVDTDEERVAEMEPQDRTESSSSFGCTDDSGIGSATMITDMEVESHMEDDSTPLSRPDGFSDLFRDRKKKLTAHWIKFVRPIMWRCKWVELQLRKLHSQACKYDKELSECETRKQSQLPKCVTEELGSKSTPYISQNRSVNLMRRKKRRRVEETVDMASYTSCHSLFSYYASKRPVADSLYMDDDHDMAHAENSPFGNNELCINGEWASEFKDANTFESKLRKVEEGQSRVRQLRVRLNKIIKEHGAKFASSGLAPGDQLASCAPKSASPCVNPENIPSGSSKQISQKLVMPDMAVPPLPDRDKGTEQAQTRGKCKKTVLKSQLHGQPLKKELNISEEVGDQILTESQLKIEVPDDGNMPVNGGRSIVKGRPISIPKLTTPNNKRKRGRRKAISGRWSKKSSG